MSKTLLEVFIGSRGRNTQSFGSDFNFRKIIYYGDDRDHHGANTVYSSRGTVSTWTYPYFVDKLFRAQFEALEMLFCQPKNFVTFNPILVPLWKSRQMWLTHKVIEKISDRCERTFRSAFRRESPDPSAKGSYDGRLVSHGMDMLASVYCLASDGYFNPQETPWYSPLRAKVLAGSLSKKEVKKLTTNFLIELREKQHQWLRAATERERYRGEVKEGKIPPMLSRGQREYLESLCEKTWNQIKTSDLETKLTKKELSSLFSEPKEEKMMKKGTVRLRGFDPAASPVEMVEMEEEPAPDRG